MSWQLKTFSELTVDELYAILQVRFQVFVLEQQCLYAELDGKDQTAYHLFKAQEGKVAAYLRIYRTAAGQAALGRVLVKKQYRGQGIAQELLERAICFVEQKLNAGQIKIQAQEYLRNFYGSWGFVPISNVYLEDGIPHVDMLRSHSPLK